MNNLVRLKAEERKDRRVYTPLAIVVLIETTGKGGQSRIGDCLLFSLFHNISRKKSRSYLYLPRTGNGIYMRYPVDLASS